MNGYESAARREEREPSDEEEVLGTGSFEPVYPPPPTPEDIAKKEALINGMRKLETANDNHVAANDNESERHPQAAIEHGHAEVSAGHKNAHPQEASDGGNTTGGQGGDHGGGNGSEGGGGQGGGSDTKHAHHAGGHHHENPWVTWGIKQPIAFFGFLVSLVFQGIKRWGEMAGKGGGGGGGGHGGGHGGGGHH